MKATQGPNAPSMRLASRLDFLSSDIADRLRQQPGTGLGRLYGAMLAVEISRVADDVRRLRDDGLTIPVPPGAVVLWDARP